MKKKNIKFFLLSIFPIVIIVGNIGGSEVYANGHVGTSTLGPNVNQEEFGEIRNKIQTTGDQNEFNNTVVPQNAGSSAPCSSTNDPDSLCSPGFEIDVKKIASGGSGIVSEQDQKGTSITAGNLLNIVIRTMTIWLGSLSLLIMTVGAGFMILYHGQDELLSKGKSIFSAGLISLVVALSSYFLVSLLRYILYS